MNRLQILIAVLSMCLSQVVFSGTAYCDKHKNCGFVASQNTHGRSIGFTVKKGKLMDAYYDNSLTDTDGQDVLFPLGWSAPVILEGITSQHHKTNDTICVWTSMKHVKVKVWEMHGREKRYHAKTYTFSVPKPLKKCKSAKLPWPMNS